MFTNAALAIVIENLNGLDTTDALVLHCVNAYDPNDLQAPSIADCVSMAVDQNEMILKSKQNVYFKFILWSTVSFSLDDMAGFIL